MAKNENRKDQDRLHDERGALEDAASKSQPSKDPQLRKVHDTSGIDDDLGRGKDVSIEDGGSRHRNR